MRGSAVPRFAKGAVFAFLTAAATGCFASVAMLDEVRQDVNTTRAESAVSDSLRAVQLVQIMSALRSVSDSIASLSARITRLRAETQADVRAMRQEVNQMQEVSGQSERRLRELRDQIDIRSRQTSPSTPSPAPPIDTVVPPVPAAPPAAPVEVTPGPTELMQIGRDQLTRGGNSAARAAFADLLRRYPESPLAVDAQFYIAESYAAEGSRAAADSAYALVVATYGESSRAPTALYKRGVLAQAGGRRTAARRLYNELIDKYPASDEAELARERLRVMN